MVSGCHSNNKASWKSCHHIICHLCENKAPAQQSDCSLQPEIRRHQNLQTSKSILTCNNGANKLTVLEWAGRELSLKVKVFHSLLSRNGKLLIKYMIQNEIFVQVKMKDGKLTLISHLKRPQWLKNNWPTEIYMDIDQPPWFHTHWTNLEICRTHVPLVPWLFKIHMDKCWIKIISSTIVQNPHVEK